jgi:hypothetical protein
VRVVRTILAFVLSVSIAVVPATAGGVPAAGQESAAKIAATGIDCSHHGAAHHDGAGGNGAKAGDDCASMTACAVKCFAYAGAVLPPTVPAPAGWRLQPIGAAGLLVAQIGNPPFRPPRV